jgi:hypothetical protein
VKRRKALLSSNLPRNNSEQLEWIWRFTIKVFKSLASKPTAEDRKLIPFKLIKQKREFEIRLLHRQVSY